MKKLINIDAKLLPMQSEDEAKYAEDVGRMGTIRDALRLIANQKTDTADDARRVRRIVIKLKDKTSPDVVLENDDMAFLQKQFERNAMNLTGWLQGQMLDYLDSAEKADPPQKD